MIAGKRNPAMIVSWSAAVLMLATVLATFCFGALLLGYVIWIWLDTEQAFRSAWHVAVAAPVGVFTAGASLWLFIFGVRLLVRVVRHARLGAISPRSSVGDKT